MRLTIALAAFIMLGGGLLPAAAQTKETSARDVAVIQSCLKSKPQAQDSCIGIIADPCLEKDETRSTADKNACTDRELAVWDDMLNDTFRRLRDKLDDQQKTKLRDMQRAWIAYKEKTCAFYWDYYQGTMASPMSSYCVTKETARRALFLGGFLEDAESNK